MPDRNENIIIAQYRECITVRYIQINNSYIMNHSISVLIIRQYNQQKAKI